MRTIKLLLIPVLALPVALGACRRQESPEVATAERTAEAQPAPAAGEAGQVVLDSLSLGKEVNSDGTVAEQSTTFRQGDPLIASFDAEDISAGTSLQLQWLGPAGRPLATDELQVPPQARVINLKAKDTSSWTPGAYRVEIAVGGASVGSKPFVITSASATGD